MNLTSKELKAIYDSQNKHFEEHGVRTLQLAMAEDIVELQNKIKELELTESNRAEEEHSV